MEILEDDKQIIREHVFVKFEKADKFVNKLKTDLAQEVSDQILSFTGYKPTKEEMSKITSLMTKYGFKEVIESVFIAIEQYCDPDNLQETIEKMCDYIGRICYTRAANKYGGIYGYVNYILKIAKNNFSYVNEKLLKKILYKHLTIDNMEEIKAIVVDSMNWTDLKQKLCIKLNIDLEKF